MDFRRCLEVQMPYLGPVIGTYTDWTPLKGRPGLFKEDIDKRDPWQFRRRAGALSSRERRRKAAFPLCATPGQIDTRLAGLGAPGQQGAARVPAHRADRARARLLAQHLGAVIDPHQQDRAVGIADRDDLLLRMAGDAADAHRKGREHLRLLAHRAVLALERPEHQLLGARGRKPLAARGPAERTHAGRIARHPHVLASTTRQPCSVGSCIAVTRNWPLALKAT